MNSLGIVFMLLLSVSAALAHDDTLAAYEASFPANKSSATVSDGARSIESKARFAHDLERNEVLNVYREGIATLCRRLGK